MFKSLVTLFRGTVHDAPGTLAVRNVFAILDQQLRDCTQAVGQARKALAIAMVQKRKEQAQLERTRARIAGLEERACRALDAGEERLAAEAVEAIAYLEAEREAGEVAQETFVREAASLKKLAKSSELRLVELRRGQRIAVAAEKANCLRGDEVTSANLSAGSLEDTERTLERLRERQADFGRTREALDKLDAGTAPSSLVEHLAEAGFEPSARTTAKDILARLRQRRSRTDHDAAALDAGSFTTAEL